ncbi:MAG: hypothetical protein ABFD25_03045 [Clostridiaceae bacterium]
MSENMVRLFRPQEGGLIGLKCIDDKLYALPAKGDFILVYKRSSNEDYSLMDKVPVSVKNATGITSDGKMLFIADSLGKAVYCIDPETKQSRLYLNMSELKTNQGEDVLHAGNSRVNDMEIHKNEMWITCSAGYSSCIYRIDTGARKVIKVIPARGPEPKSISFDASAKCMKVLDSSNREISDFTLEGEWTGKLVKVPVDNPACFTVDENRQLIISNCEANRRKREV